RYELTSPVFDEVEISLDPAYYSGKRFKIIAHNNSPENIYIQSITLNGKPLNRLWISHEEITRGGVLEFEMGDQPVDSYGLE
ncbi:MAG: glycoside hydrolase domain-containing protein, partial [Parabacteroides sp.]